MKKVWSLAMLLSFFLPSQLRAQEETAAADSPEAASAALSEWLKGAGATPVKGLPKRWIFMQTQSTAYGAPAPLVFDRMSFESHGWFESADPDSVRFYFQLNPKLKTEELSEAVVQQRLQLFMNMTASDAMVVRESEADKEKDKKEGEGAPAWVFYTRSAKGILELGRADKGPESMRQEVLAKWLVTQLGYDAIVMGQSKDYIILAKLKPVKRGAQGLIMKGTTSTVMLKDTKDVGALVRVVYEAEDYLVANLLLSKSGKPKVPTGSKVLFSD